MTGGAEKTRKPEKTRKTSKAEKAEKAATAGKPGKTRKTGTEPATGGSSTRRRRADGGKHPQQPDAEHGRQTQRTERHGRLAAYRAKRRFGRTAEPSGDEETEGAQGPRFVVQIHDARSLHFDFRLEVDGVLKSWSVPKGPSADPHDKRLAIPTEDHPMEYRSFEGVIPPGEYGGGTVIVWDQGTYRQEAHDRRGPKSHGKDPHVPFGEALRRGHARFRLDGTKLRGSWALTRIRGGDASGGTEREAWLLVKSDDSGTRSGAAATPDPRRARSARSGRTLRQVAADPRDEWHSERT